MGSKKKPSNWEMRNRYRLIATHSRVLPALWQKFRQLARENNRTANAALNMLVEDAVKHWTLPSSKTDER